MAVNIVMNPGEGPNSYVQSSKYQGAAVDAVKSIIKDEIKKKLDVDQLQAVNCFCIADFGCSTGHNSFRIMEVITDSVLEKFETPPDIQVFFNDQVMNDFNTLFKSLPPQPQRRYHASGSPGSFFDCLFAKDSIHFAHSCWSLHWLSEVPKALTDPTSPAYNKGRCHYIGAPKEVYVAYLGQWEKDIGSFLDARAQELVDGGLLAFLIPAVPNSYDSDTGYVIPTAIILFDSCLHEIINEGRFNIDENVMDLINMPFYMPTPKEMKGILEKKSDKFSVERMEILDNPGSKVGWRNPRDMTAFYRSASECVFKKYLEIDVIDELFSRLQKGFEASTLFVPENDKTVLISIILKKHK